MHRHLAFIGLGLMLILGAAQACAENVRPPFDVDVRHAVAPALPLAPLRAFMCEAAPEPVVRLAMDGFYADRGQGSSVVDEVKMASYRTMTKAVDSFETSVARASDRVVRSGDNDAARCTLAWLDRWAQAGAMLDAATSQGAYVRKWGLAPVAAAFLKIRDMPNLNRDAMNRVRDWMSHWASAVRDEYDVRPSLSSHRNNHLYWAAWSVGLASVAVDDQGLLDWSIAKARFGIGQVTEDGYLPLEMERKGRALHYHVFAAAPLVLMAELAAANGVDLYAEQNGALHRLVTAIVVGLDDSAPFARAAGATQETNGLLSGSNLGWLEAYVARFPNRPEAKDAARYLTRVRPAFNRWYGGDATLLYGAETLP